MFNDAAKLFINAKTQLTHPVQQSGKKLIVLKSPDFLYKQAQGLKNICIVILKYNWEDGKYDKGSSSPLHRYQAKNLNQTTRASIRRHRLIPRRKSGFVQNSFSVKASQDCNYIPKYIRTKFT